MGVVAVPCGTRSGWPGLCRGVMVVQWEEHGWREPGFPLQVSGQLLLGVCATGTGYAARLGVGGLDASSSAPVRGPQPLSERILASAWGLDTVPKAVLSWYIPGSAAACEVGASGTLGRGPMTGSGGLGEDLRRTWDSGGHGSEVGGCVWW